MWNWQTLTRIDFRILPVIFGLMMVSLLVISSNSQPSPIEGGEEVFLTPLVKSQIKWFAIGWGVFSFFSAFDYNKLREWTWFLYALVLIALLGLFFTKSIVGVNRWYRIPLLGVSIQPSEYAKLVVIIALSWFLERSKQQSHRFGTVVKSAMIVGIPFLLIFKQPDLGTALVLFPITLVMFYFGDIHPVVVNTMKWVGGSVLLLVALIFLGVIPHEDLRPIATKFLKEYQFDRLDPNTHHQRVAATAIAVGGVSGTGWGKSEFTGRGWLPAPYTDSVFPAFVEEFGLIGLVFLLVLFYLLIYFSFQVTSVAKDHFGRLLSAGVAVYLAMHILMNIGMMTGFLPITGVPLILVTYGGSSILSTMTALGILQSIYSRRFMF
ncbi:Septum-peptidoglycan biosynthetic protein [Waddlia chondrophila 2032/99]|uniref:Septum-peptidoglycan biosynthetic protein n=2 Tax=Waddlia chondrophila TaxID=71667 RepID=D6YU66_WADCW|nr:FtsW/RodA/SpoVE family cell cycle protein [Waddlia chondrophila]ADI37677.1 Septum-peptidoglycan biosynthetic protein [Waddlia chondrophila WSU 86-1044]CCB90525.1 Septum-peptidoglycan biosynthetic protein [Waddlia chondrophila 2032/99]